MVWVFGTTTGFDRKKKTDKKIDLRPNSQIQSISEIQF